MSNLQDPVGLIEEWLSDGPDIAPDRVLGGIVDQLPAARQERRGLRRMFEPSSTLVAAMAVALLLAIGLLLVRGNVGNLLFPTPTPIDSPAAFGRADVLAFTRGGDLWVSAADGSHARPLTTGSNVGSPAWSPDGSLLAYDQDGALHTLDAAGTVRLVADAEAGGPFYGPSWSPDGTELLATAADGFAVVSLDGSVRLLSQASMGLCVSWPEWGPDNVIVFTGNTDCATGAEPTSLFAMNPDGSGLHELFGHGSQVFAGAWSPDGARIAFIDLAGDGCIYAMDADGTTVSQVKAHCTTSFRLTWTSDGSQIAWAGGPDGEAPAFVINADGSDIRGIAGLTSVANLDWRPETP